MREQEFNTWISEEKKKIKNNCEKAEGVGSIVIGQICKCVFYNI